LRVAGEEDAVSLPGTRNSELATPLATPFDLGIAFDGDADRIGAVDSRGRILWGDQLLLLYAEEVADAVPGALVIADVKAGRTFFEEARKRGAQPLMWKTGHSHIKSKMKSSGALVAGEMSGHMFFAHQFYGHDDAIYAALRLLNRLARPESPSLAEILDALPATVATPDLRIPVPEGRKFEIIEEVRARLARDGTPFNDVDGMRVEKPEGWWLLRASNTGELLTVRAEAANEADLARLTAEVAAQLRLSGVEMG
jgi:phosphomannomutase